MPFTLDEIDRYDRQMLLAGWGAAGQERLRAATVEVHGRGVAAEMAARYLAAAGVGTLRLASFADEARDVNPFVQVHNIPPAPGQPDPDPPSPGDPEHPDQPGPETPHPEEPAPEEPAVARVQVESLDARLVAAEDRAAVGSALAVEVLKAILGAPFESRVSLALEARAP